MKTLTAWSRGHPALSAWIVLGLAMVIVLLLAAGGAGLTATQTFWAALATIALAGGCVWLVAEAD